MSATICLGANALYYPQGGHLWAYLNWALGLRAVGAEVIWLEAAYPRSPTEELRSRIATLKGYLKGYGLADDIALCSWTGTELPAEATAECVPLEDVLNADLLLNLQYDLPPRIVRAFRRTALVDIDPGLLQMWMRKGELNVAPHDVYFTIGEARTCQSGYTDTGLDWQRTAPCVALDAWPPAASSEDAPFTTVSHWSADEWVEDGGEVYHNDKRSGFAPFVEVPRQTSQAIELALCLGKWDTDEENRLREHGWRVRSADSVAGTPDDYQHYVQASRGEFSCAKPSYVRLRTAWISDRTVCYLASGKPAVVQYTGPSDFLPDDAGLFRFRDLSEAVRHLESAASDYATQSRYARALAEEHFDARKVVGGVLEKALA